MTTPKADLEAALNFLKRWKPAGPWVLTAIRVDKEGIETKTFDPDSETYCLGFLNKHGDRNIYFHVNSTGPLTKKAEKKHVKSVDWFHIDIDPRAGQDLDQERKRALGLLTDNLPKGVPPPTVIIFSGGGYQAFWKLREPIQIGGDLALALEAERYTRKLETLFEADRCHNIDRIMRLPGTVNWPDAKKVKKGRKPALATLDTFEPDRVYDLADFKKAEALETAGAAKPTEETAAPTVTVADRASLESLGLKPSVVEMIVMGRAGAPKEKDDSKSAWQWHVLGELMRDGLSDEQIYQIVTTKDFGISKASDDSEWWRQILKARSKNPSGEMPRLAEQIIRINRTYFAALTGTKIRYFREEPNDSLVAMQKEAFLFETAPILYEGDDKKIKQANGPWLKSSDRRYFKNGFALVPDGTPDDVYNLWKGFAVEPAPGDWSLMRRHIERILAGGDAVASKYIIDWTAWAFQYPGRVPGVALVFKGGEGVGKGVYARSVCDIFGPFHAKQITSGHHFTGHFNAHLRNLCILFADEAVAAGSTEEGTLKGLITEPTIPIEAKGVDVEWADNHLHIIMATNNEWAVPISHDGRRYAIFNVSDAKQKKLPYFTALVAQMKDGGRAAMLFDLLARDLSNFNPEGCRPDTEGMVEQKILSLRPTDACFYAWLQSGEIPGIRIKEGIDGEGVVIYSKNNARAGGLFDGMRATSPALKGEHDSYLRRHLKDFGAIDYYSNGKRGWRIPPLAAARGQWKTLHGYPKAWDSSEDGGWSNTAFGDRPLGESNE